MYPPIQTPSNPSPPAPDPSSPSSPLEPNPTWPSSQPHLPALFSSPERPPCLSQSTPTGHALPSLPEPVTSRLAHPLRRRTWCRLCQSLPLHFFRSITSISLLVFVAFIGSTWITLTSDANYLVLSTTPGMQQQRFIIGDSFQLDTSARTLSAQYKVVACDILEMSSEPITTTVQLPDGCQPSLEAFDLYVDDPSKPVFSYNPSELVGETLSVPDRFDFTIQHQIHKCERRGPLKRFKDPFDHYVFNTFAFAINPITNHSIPIATFVLTGTLGDFVLRSHQTPFTNKFTYNPGGGFVSTKVKSHLLQADVELSMIARVIAVCLALLSWSLTIGAIHVTGLVVRRKLNPNNLLVALPFGAPITILTIRSFPTGPPLFGASVDSVAFVVQFFAVSMCCFSLLYFLTQDR